MRRILWVIGPAGSGKTTISKQVSAIVGAEFISSGDIVRSLADSHKDLANGDLYYNDDAIMGGISDRINRTNREIILVDGVPRTEGQVTWISKNLKAYLWSVVYIDAPAIKRIGRLIKRNRDDYDTAEVIMKRITKDETNMQQIRDICFNMLRHDKIKFLESLINGNTSAEVDRVMTLLRMMEE